MIVTGEGVHVKSGEIEEHSSQEEETEDEGGDEEDNYLHGTQCFPLSKEVQGDELDTSTEEVVTNLEPPELHQEDNQEEDSQDEASYRRPQRERRAPQRYGDWVFAAVSDMDIRLKALENLKNKQHTDKPSKSKWMTKIFRRSNKIASSI